MYGVPLTIYVLTGVLGIDIPLIHNSGHLWATLLGYGMGGDQVEMLLGSVFILAGTLLIVKGWIRIYFAKPDDVVVRNGVYGIIRYPRYVGIFLIIFGQIIHWPTILTLVMSPFIVWLFVDLARREEGGMVKRFGDDYHSYQHPVPRFFPAMNPWFAKP